MTFLFMKKFFLNKRLQLFLVVPISSSHCDTAVQGPGQRHFIRKAIHGPTNSPGFIKYIVALITSNRSKLFACP